MRLRGDTVPMGDADPSRGRDGGAPAALAIASERLAVTALRIGLLLLAAVAAGDTLLLAASRGASPRLLVGLAIAALAIAGAQRPEAAARLLLPRGRVLALALLLSLLCLPARGLRESYSDVEFGLSCLAAIIASPTLVVAFIAASALGLMADELALGHSLAWTLTGPGADHLVTQLAIMLAGAVVWIGVTAVLKRTIAGAAATINDARAGIVLTLTPRLGAAIRGEPAGLLVRASPAALLEPLSPAERRVLGLLADGLAPKQAARHLHVALSTVRSQIAAAKRKTGARTLEQLVALVAQAPSAG